jgi:hypothetical protein
LASGRCCQIGISRLISFSFCSEINDFKGAGEDPVPAGFLSLYARSRDVASARTLGRLGAFPADLTPRSPTQPVNGRPSGGHNLRRS